MDYEKRLLESKNPNQVSIILGEESIIKNEIRKWTSSVEAINILLFMLGLIGIVDNISYIKSYIFLINGSILLFNIEISLINPNYDNVFEHKWINTLFNLSQSLIFKSIDWILFALLVFFAIISGTFLGLDKLITFFIFTLISIFFPIILERLVEPSIIRRMNKKITTFQDNVHASNYLKK